MATRRCRAGLRRVRSPRSHRFPSVREPMTARSDVAELAHSPRTQPLPINIVNNEHRGVAMHTRSGPSTNRLRKPMLALAALALITTASCGSDDNSTSDTTAGTAAATGDTTADTAAATEETTADTAATADTPAPPTARRRATPLPATRRGRGRCSRADPGRRGVRHGNGRGGHRRADQARRHRHQHPGRRLHLDPEDGRDLLRLRQRQRRHLRSPDRVLLRGRRRPIRHCSPRWRPSSSRTTRCSASSATPTSSSATSTASTTRTTGTTRSSPASRRAVSPVPSGPRSTWARTTRTSAVPRPPCAAGAKDTLVRRLAQPARHGLQQHAASTDFAKDQGLEGKPILEDVPIADPAGLAQRARPGLLARAAASCSTSPARRSLPLLAGDRRAGSDRLGDLGQLDTAQRPERRRSAERRPGTASSSSTPSSTCSTRACPTTTRCSKLHDDAGADFPISSFAQMGYLVGQVHHRGAAADGRRRHHRGDASTRRS